MWDVLKSGWWLLCVKKREKITKKVNILMKYSVK